MTDEKRRQIALAATPGPWYQGIGYDIAMTTAISAGDGKDIRIVDSDYDGAVMKFADAVHIAANSPDEVIKLLDRIAALRLGMNCAQSHLAVDSNAHSELADALAADDAAQRKE